jgi:hypothetical protein
MADMNHPQVRLAIEARLASSAESPLLSIGDGDHCVVVRLTPNAAPIAEELMREFGDSVSITVGFKPFPPGSVDLGYLPPETAGAATWRSAMRFTCEVADSLIPRGDSTRGRLTILNCGNAPVKFDAGVNVGLLCVPGTFDVVGGYSGAMSAGARVVELDTGGIASFNFIVGTASCEANNRYVVEPGGYDVLVPLSISDIGTRDPDRLLVQDSFVRVT